MVELSWFLMVIKGVAEVVVVAAAVEREVAEKQKAKVRRTFSITFMALFLDCEHGKISQWQPTVAQNFNASLQWQQRSSPIFPRRTSRRSSRGFGSCV